MSIRNQRMINGVAVGIVYVGGTGDFAITNNEKTHILARAISGLDDLSGNEPRAKLAWNYSTLSVNLDEFTPWAGARWPGMDLNFYKGMDAALWSEANQRIYFFKGNQYYRVNPSNGWRADAGYPKPITGNWPGLPSSFDNRIDAALWAHSLNKLYFFSGSEYVRVDPNNGWQMDAGYPKPIAGNWPGFPAEFASGVDSTIWSVPNQRVYFFKGDKYLRVNPSSGWAVETGYPKPIAGNWPGLPDNYNEGVDAALWSKPNERIYFFKKGSFWEGTYVRVNPASGWSMESGYPKPIGLSTYEAEMLWRGPAQAKLGHNASESGLLQLVDALQSTSGSQFGYVTFFTKFPTLWFAYAGGNRVVMRSGEGSSFTNWLSIDNVFAHETGHIFGAPDEYSSSKCKCTNKHGKFFSVDNGNCAFESCADSPVSCVMRSAAASQVCDFTPYHIGWGSFLEAVDAGIYSFHNSKIYLFSEDYYVRLTKDFVLESGYPKPITGNWPGLPTSFAQGLDAAVYSKTNNRIYFFKGNQYIRVNPAAGWLVEAGYPKPIVGNWPGFPSAFAAGVDAAVWSDTNKRIYFFKGSQYIRVDPAAGWQVEVGYPKAITGNWPGFPGPFANGVDSGLWSEGNKRIYFFKGTRYLRVNPSDHWKVEGGYPAPINVNWRMPFPVG
jgi:hypothetical protein